MKAADFVDIDNDIPAFDEWFDSRENILVCHANEQYDEDEDDDSNYAYTDAPPKITEAIEMIQKLRLYLSNK